MSKDRNINNEVAQEISNDAKTVIAGAAGSGAAAAYTAGTAAGVGTTLGAGAVGAAVGIATYKTLSALEEGGKLIFDIYGAQKNEHTANVAKKTAEIKMQNPNKPIEECFKEAEKEFTQPNNLHQPTPAYPPNL